MNMDIKKIHKKNIIPMFTKSIKWGKNFLRLIKLKIHYGNRFSVDLFCKRMAYIGNRCKISIKGNGKIILHEKVYLDDCCMIIADHGTVDIGEECYFNTYSRLIAKRQIIIGKGSLFGSNVSIYDHDHDVTNGIRNASHMYKIDPVNIGRYVWCGTNVVITRGVQIGENCVVGANATVTKNLSENGVYVGQPAVLKKYLEAERRNT